MNHLMCETFSTAGLAPRQSVAYWNRLMRDTFDSAAVCLPRDPSNFSAYLTRMRLGSMVFVEVSSDTAVVRQGASKGAGCRGLYVLQLLLEGTCTKRQCGRQAHLRQGDFTICDGDGARPFESVYDGPHRQLSIGIPKDLLRRYLGYPEMIVAVRMCGTNGVSGLVSNTLMNFWTLCCQDPAGMQVNARAIHALLELTAAAYADLPQAEAGDSTLELLARSRVLAYIEAHLYDPDLVPTKIANALGMTARNLHYIFSDEGETVGRYILRRRLEEASRAILSEPLRGRTLTDIALDLGFGGVTHFGRVFRTHYGVTPSQYRLRIHSRR